MKEINDFLLNLFTADEKMRRLMAFPNLKDGIVYASDGFVIIAIPETELSLKYKSNDKYPDVQRLFDDFEEGNVTYIKVKVDEIAKELVKARIIIDKNIIECKECNGKGNVEVEYDDWGYMDENCQECKGEGEIETEHPFARVSLSMIKDSETGKHIGISIGELYFHPFHLYRLFMVALAKGYEEIEIYYDREKYGKTVIYLGHIVVMVVLKKQQ